MAKLFQFELVVPDQLVLSKALYSVTIPGSEGEFGVLADHSPFLSTIGMGLLNVQETEHSNQYFGISGGYAEVLPDRVTVMAEELHAIDDIDEEAMQTDIKEMEEVLTEMAPGSQEQLQLQRRVDHANHCLELCQTHRK